MADTLTSNIGEKISMKGISVFKKPLKYISVSLGVYLATTGMANAACPAGSNILSNFPATITSGGTYCITSHKILATPNITAITIAASNVTLDLDRWELRGPGVYSDSVSGYGIAVTNNAQNVTIRNGALVGFNAGIIMATNSGSNYTDGLVVDNMSIRSMGMAGVMVSLNSYCNSCTIKNSNISNTDANRVTTQGGFSGAYAIYFERSNDITIKNNVITGVYSRGTLPSYGIYLKGGQNAQVEDNTVSDTYNSTTNDTGIQFFSFRNANALDNHLSYFYYGIRYSYSSGGHAGNTFYLVTKPITGGTAL